MHLFGCLVSMTTRNSHDSTTSSSSASDPAVRIHHSAAISGTDSGSSNKRIICKTNLVRELRVDYAVGDGISGILYKWVNFGKGWRPRWFVLHDGVLSFYKIHGPDKIHVSNESVKGSRVIGDESTKWILRQPHPNHHHTNPSNDSSPKSVRKATGEVHLKVSYLCESSSDDKKFSIFTGTKWIHLRAETREDKLTWIEACRAAKDMVSKIPRGEAMAPINDMAVSTDKLRRVLVREGLNGDAIQDIERIMKSEFASLQNQLIVLKQKHWLLKETLRQLGVHVRTSQKSISLKS